VGHGGIDGEISIDLAARMTPPFSGQAG